MLNRWRGENLYSGGSRRVKCSDLLFCLIIEVLEFLLLYFTQLDIVS